MTCPSGHTGQVRVSKTPSGSFSAAPRQGKSAPRVAVPPLPAARVRYRLLLGQLGLVCLHLGPQGKSAPRVASSASFASTSDLRPQGKSAPHAAAPPCVPAGAVPSPAGPARPPSPPPPSEALAGAAALLPLLFGRLPTSFCVPGGPPAAWSARQAGHPGAWWCGAGPSGQRTSSSQGQSHPLYRASGTAAPPEPGGHSLRAPQPPSSQ